MGKFTCGYRTVQGMADNDSPFRYSGANLDTWQKRENYLVCSYCGSLQPEQLFRGIEQGCEVSTTDKSYKLYITLPGDGKKRSRSSTNFPKGGYKKVPFKKEWRTPATPTTNFEGKFYFYHFSDADKKRFIGLVNDKKIKYGGGFGFYTLPFFMTRSE